MTTAATSPAVVSPASEIADQTYEELRLELAKQHDVRIRFLERQQVATWSEMAEIAILVRDNREWEILGHESFNQWLKDAAPQSRASIYAGMGLVSALDDISKADLAQIPQGTAKVLKSLPGSMRRKRDIIQKAKQLRPRQFISEIQQSSPELHIERTVKRAFQFEQSQERVIDAAIEMANLLEAGQMTDEVLLSDESALERICAEWMQIHQIMYDMIKNGEVIES